MIWYIIGLVIAFAGGYLVGSNNPLPSVKKKILQQSRDSIDKILKS